VEIGAVARNFELTYDFGLGKICDIDHKERINLFESDEI
jgi:hypothetical protein